MSVHGTERMVNHLSLHLAVDRHSPGRARSLRRKIIAEIHLVQYEMCGG